MIALVLIIILILLPTLAVGVFCSYMSGKTPSAGKVEKADSGQCEEVRAEQGGNPLKLKISRFMDSLVFFYGKGVGKLSSHWLRNLLYRHVLKVRMAKTAVIYYGLEVRSPWNLSIGEGSIIGDQAILDARYGITIEDNVNLSSGVWVWTLQHDVNSPTFSTEGEEGPVVIKRRAWVSSRTTVLPGCNVAEGAVLAAGAVLTKSIDEPFSIWGGLPAKRIGRRNQDLVYEFDGSHRLFL